MENTSGITPTWNRVLVLPDTVSERAGKEGLIIKAQVVKDKEQMAQVKMTLVAVGGNAFDLGTPEEWQPPIPQPGDRVYVAKYAGIIVKGEDDQIYRLVNDQDVVGIITEKKE